MSSDAYAAHPERVEALARQVGWLRDRVDEQADRIEDLETIVEILAMDVAEAGELEDYDAGFGIDSADEGRLIPLEEPEGKSR